MMTIYEFVQLQKKLNKFLLRATGIFTKPSVKPMAVKEESEAIKEQDWSISPAKVIQCSNITVKQNT